MITDAELLELLTNFESPRIERTISIDKSDKFREAICAFANDLLGSNLPGYLLIGVDDKTGKPTGLKATDRLLRDLSGLGTDGTILPQPALMVEKFTFPEGDIVVVEVQPAILPPVRFEGKIFIRRGPRKGVANEAEEKQLTERRPARIISFDAQPCIGSSLDDLAIDLFTTGYLPEAVDEDILLENHRPNEVKLASLRFFDLQQKCPTVAGILLFGKNVRYHLPYAGVLYIKYAGTKASDDILNNREFEGDLFSVLRELDRFAKEIINTRPVQKEGSELQEINVSDYPSIALRELLMNAVMHRAYDQHSLVRVLHFTDRIEIQSPGTLYGPATEKNFPQQTSYRNPVIAEAMKVLGFVNRFGRGVIRAQKALEDNGSASAEFEFGDTFFLVTIKART